jgi:hypothetical protein
MSVGCGRCKRLGRQRRLSDRAALAENGGRRRPQPQVAPRPCPLVRNRRHLHNDCEFICTCRRNLGFCTVHTMTISVCITPIIDIARHRRPRGLVVTRRRISVFTARHVRNTCSNARWMSWILIGSLSTARIHPHPRDGKFLQILPTAILRSGAQAPLAGAETRTQVHAACPLPRSLMRWHHGMPTPLWCLSMVAQSPPKHQTFTVNSRWSSDTILSQCCHGSK